MPGTVWRLVISKLLHQGCEVTVIVVPVIKVLLIWRMEQISSPCGLCSSCGEADPLVQEVQRQITCGNRQGNDHAGEQQQKMVVQTGIG